MGKGKGIMDGFFPQGGDGPKGDPPGAIKVKNPDLKPDQLLSQRAKVVANPSEAPAFLGLSAGMSPLQQRTAIATNAVNGNQGIDSEGLSHYRQLALSSLINHKGQFADPSEISPIERQYLDQAGVRPRNNTTESFLSALDRALKNKSDL